jgi:hypothetical protein
VSAPGVEAFLARLYIDAALRAIFLRDHTTMDKTAAKAAMADWPLTEIEQNALLQIDRVGLQMVAASYANKRVSRSKNSKNSKKREVFDKRFFDFLLRR